MFATPFSMKRYEVTKTFRLRIIAEDLADATAQAAAGIPIEWELVRFEVDKEIQ